MCQKIIRKKTNKIEFALRRDRWALALGGVKYYYWRKVNEIILSNGETRSF